MNSAAWLPLDLRWPPARVAAVLQAAAPIALLTAAGNSSSTRPDVPTGLPLLPVRLGELQRVSVHCGSILSDNSTRCCKLTGHNHRRQDALPRACLGQCCPRAKISERHSWAGTAPEAGVAADAGALAQSMTPLQQRVAYMIFTSGSTGEPLGVCGTVAGERSHIASWQGMQWKESNSVTAFGFSLVVSLCQPGVLQVLQKSFPG